MNGFLLDTNILIDVSHRSTAAITALQNLPSGQRAISVITVGELYSGARANEMAELKRIWSLCTVRVDVGRSLLRLLPGKAQQATPYNHVQ